MKKILIKYQSMSAPTKSAIWFTICNLFLKGISFITVPIFTRLMSDEEYGILSIYMSYEQLFLIFSTWEIQMGAYQKGIFNYKEDIKVFTKSTQALVNILTCIFFAILFIFNIYVKRYTDIGVSVLVFLFIYMLVQPAYNCWLIRQRTDYKYISAVVVTILYSLANVIVPMIAIILIGRTANIKFCSGLIISSVICLFFFIPNSNYWVLFKQHCKVFRYWKFLLKFEGPLVMHSLSYLVLSQADRIMIGNQVGKAQAAYYSVAYSIANVVSLIQNSINQSLLPWRYQMLEQKEYKKIEKVTNYLLLMISAGVLVFILIAPEIIKLLFEETYYDAVWSIPPISVSVYFMFLYTIFVNIETYYEETKYVMYVSVVCAALNIVLNYICIGIFGYIACGYTTLVSYILFAIGHYYFMQKILKKNCPEGSVVDKKRVIEISIITIMIAMLFTLLYSKVIIRYLIVFAVIVIIIWKKERIKSYLVMMKKR